LGAGAYAVGIIGGVVMVIPKKTFTLNQHLTLSLTLPEVLHEPVY